MYELPDTATAEYTKQLAAEGVRLLSFMRLSADERDHVAAMLSMADTPMGGTAVDLGSGTGEFARLAAEVRPDIAFTCVNDNAWQLSQSPDTSYTVLADMVSTGLPDEHFDTVFISYALGHAGVIAVLREAYRLLTPGGRVVIHDQFVRNQIQQQSFQAALNYQLHQRRELSVWLDLLGLTEIGFAKAAHIAPGNTVAQVAHSGLLDDLEYGVLVAAKTHSPRIIPERTALHFSGGKDSLACLYILRPLLHELLVYHMDTGDRCPETAAVVETVRQWVPNFIEVHSNALAWRAQFGDPTDLMPARAHALGVAYGMSEQRLTCRFDCCFQNLMRPMHERMLADGIQAVIRGTKLCDTGKVPADGKTEFYDVLLPIKNWSHQDVFDYLKSVGAPENPIYAHFKSISAPECFTCTAWWDDNKAAYYKALHPQQLTVYRSNLLRHAQIIQSHIADLDTELKE